MVIKDILSFVSPILFYLLVLYLTLHSKITADKVYGRIFWAIIIVLFSVLTWMQWNYPALRFIILVSGSLALVVVYYLHFRKREKSHLDYLKLCWLLFFSLDNITVNFMRFIYKNYPSTTLVTKDSANLVSEIFNITHIVILSIIAFMTYKELKNKRISLKNEQNKIIRAD